jgi:single-stranded-DNA-specific exonuclease
MSYKHWNIFATPNQEIINALKNELNISEPTAVLLANREIVNFEQAKAFFRPELSMLHDPFLMKDMQIAVDRLEKAISNEEKVLVYGDYDVDGTTSVSMMYSFLKENFPNLTLEYYIPDRYKEGYGVSLLGIEYAHEGNFDLIITLDCGIKGGLSLKLAHEYGIDVIVCDHHLPDDILPVATAILDPKRTDCPYPFKELSGCGVGFKLIEALCLQLQLSKELALKYLDYVTISICADIVPIVGENRVLAYYGLKLLNRNTKPGIEALKNIAGIKSEINVHNIVFGFAPRINAAGRIEHAKASVDMLIAETQEHAMNYAKVVSENNSVRRDFDSSITIEALEMIESDDFTKNAWSTVLFKNDWNKGVVGIVASRCIEKYHRPTIILTESNGKAVGSARSIPGFDLYKGIGACEELLEQYGGHTHAAGITIKIENIEAFKHKFDKIVRNSITEKELIQSINVDYELKFDDITRNFFNIVQQFAPFGPQNMQPVFVTEQVYYTSPPRIMKEEHIKFNLFQVNNGSSFEAVGFKMAEFGKLLKPETPFNICYQIVENTFNNQSKLELLLKDIHTI